MLNFSNKFESLILGIIYGLRLAYLETNDEKFEEMRITLVEARDKAGSAKRLINYAILRDRRQGFAGADYYRGMPPPQSIYYAARDLVEGPI